MTNNFKILHDFDLSKKKSKIIEMIDKIEKKIFDKEIDYISIDSNKILEYIFFDDYFPNQNLHEKITNFKKRNLVPSKVQNALFTIKNTRNEESHAYTKKTDEPYMIKKDIHFAIELIKQIFIVIKYFIILENKKGWYDNPENEKEYIFDSSAYNENSNNENSNNENSNNENSNNENSNNENDIKPNNDLISIKRKGIFELISSKYSFLIPPYQRDYDWKKENIEIFLNDIQDRMNDKQIHYMGTLAIAENNDKQILKLIDGQQRITTSMLLIKAIIAKFESYPNFLIPDELKEIKNDLANKYKNSSSIYSDVNHIKTILTGTYCVDKDFKNSQAFKNFTIIKDFIQSFSEDKLLDFYTTFVFYFVIGELRIKEDLSQEIQIFENLNSKGTFLSQWDLIKNYIFKKVEMNFLVENEKHIEKLLKDWFEIPASEEFGYKDKNKNLEIFFQIYNRIIFKLESGKVLNEKNKTHKIFTKIWPRIKTNEFSSIEELKKELIFIARCFNIFCEIQSKKYRDINSPLFDLWLYLENTSIKNVHYGIIINAIVNNGEWDQEKLIKINKNKLKKLIELASNIDKYITRLIVVRGTGQSLSIFLDKFISNSLEETKSNFLKNISSCEQTFLLPQLHEFEKKLKEKNDWTNSYALCILRTFLHDPCSVDSKVYQIIKKPSLEHILPQKLEKNSEWILQSGLNENKFWEKHSLKVNKIGNFLILPKTNNSKLKNKSFLKKLEIYKKTKISKLISGVNHGLNNNALMNITNKSQFTFDDIDKRTNQLSDIISPLYKLSNEK